MKLLMTASLLSFRRHNKFRMIKVGMTIQVWVPDTRRVSDLTGTGIGTIFYPWAIQTEMGTGRVFFPPANNPMGTRYFTTVIILDCEQVKMYSFCYINYDLF
jgi:hypothetical protein